LEEKNAGSEGTNPAWPIGLWRDRDEHYVIQYILVYMNKCNPNWYLN